MLLPLPAFGTDDSFATGGFPYARAEDANARVGHGVDFTGPPVVTTQGSACAESFLSKGSATALCCSPLCFRLCFSHCCSPLPVAREKNPPQWPKPDRMDSLGLGFCPASPTEDHATSSPDPASGLAARRTRPGKGFGVPRRCSGVTSRHHPRCGDSHVAFVTPVAAPTVIFPREHQLLPIPPLLQMRRSELSSVPPRSPP